MAVNWPSPMSPVIAIVICIVIMLGLTFFTSKTKMGKAMRACSEDKGAAQLMGINVNATISTDLCHRLWPGSCGRRAALLRLSHPGAHHRLHAWHQSLHRSRFRRHRLHPRRSAGRSAAWASSRSSPRPTSPPSLSDAVVFVVLIIVLLVKPAGLLGKEIREKV